jgi:hypothetical protein
MSLITAFGITYVNVLNDSFVTLASSDVFRKTMKVLLP